MSRFKTKQLCTYMPLVLCKCKAVVIFCFCFRYQEKLRVHALRVMAVVEKILNRIDCEENAAKVNYIRSVVTN